ncbi:MAG: VWA domain-containing protein [Myxococcota bacterium]|nr:VWA domain-containing protein [Myxococcota bacterium]
MSVEFPWMLLGVLALPIVFWCHRRGPQDAAVAFSALFLLESTDKTPTRRRTVLFMRGLLGARICAISVCVTAALGIDFTNENGTLVLLVGPVTPAGDWSPPITYVRAGYPPTQVSDPSSVRPVDASANYDAALQFGRRLSPRGRVVLSSERRPDKPMIKSAGVDLIGADVVVSVTADTAGLVELVGDDNRHRLNRRGSDWYFRGAVSPGVAGVAIDGKILRYVCIPDTRPLKVADTGWPPEVRAVLNVLPDVVFVPSERATWRVGPTRPKGAGWAAFSEFSTHFVFSKMPNEGTAPLWFEGDLPDPQAVARRWQALESPGRIVMRAGGRAVVDVLDGPSGRTRRFGFQPADTDLTQTAAWPVVFFDALEADRRARNRCRTHVAGQDLTVFSDREIQVTYDGGPQKTVRAVAGRAVVTGLDTSGWVRLAAGGRIADVVVVPDESAEAQSAIEGVGAFTAGRVSRTLWLTCALGAVLLVGFVGGWARPWFLLAAIALVLGHAPGYLGQLGKAPVILAVDVSASMPMKKTAELVRALEDQLGEAVTHRVEGADRVRKIAQPGEPVGRPSGETRFGPMIDTATELAGPSGVVVLLSDGRASDGVVASGVPVFTVAASATAPDARIVRGQAVRVGGQVFVQIELACDLPTEGILKVGGLSRTVVLQPGQISVVKGTLPDSSPNLLTVVLQVDDDRTTANNTLPILVRGQLAPVAVVLGAVGERWASQAGFLVKRYSPSSILEAGADIGTARAMVIVDQPAAMLSTLLVDRIERWVQGGGMLLLAGRTRAFGPGGWSGHPIDALSPLGARPTDDDDETVGVVALIDRSGSVSEEAGGAGLSVVGTLAARLGRGLRPRDKIGVLAFGGRVETLLPMTSVARLEAGMIPVPTRALGGTVLMPALAQARQSLANAGVRRGRIVVISDGRFADGDRPPVERLANGVDEPSVFGILLGDDIKREPLCPLARRTGGTCIELSNETARKTFDTTTLLMAGRYQHGSGTVRPTDAWPQRVGGPTPIVEGRVDVSERPEARVLARVGQAPLMAEWQIGRGRVIAMATDAWALTDEQWIALWAPALAPREAGPRMSIQDDFLFIDTHPSLAPPDGEVTIRSSRGQVSQRQWSPVGPGRANVRLPKGSNQVLDIETMTDDGPMTARLVRGHSAEVAQTELNLATLKLQAEVTGARMLTQVDSVGPILEARGQRGRFPWSAIASILAVCFLLLDALQWAGLFRREMLNA